MTYNTRLNNYHLKKKNSTIYTPAEVSKFIFELLKNEVEPLNELILDPCCGQGSLLAPWKKVWNELVYPTAGIDLDPNSLADWQTDFLSLTTEDFYRNILWEPSLILCNSPFNGMKPQLAPEVWLDKIIELFGKNIPIVLFAPIELRICHNYHGKRYQKFIKNKYPPISSIITLPRTIFPNVKFPTEILIFNIPRLKPHYFYQLTGPP